MDEYIPFGLLITSSAAMLDMICVDFLRCTNKEMRFERLFVINMIYKFPNCKDVASIPQGYIFINQNLIFHQSVLFWKLASS